MYDGNVVLLKAFIEWTNLLTIRTLFGLLKSHTEKYRSLICCERKILFLL
jgi:hypothetical protein